ncbi:flagellar motor switch protein FliN [Halomonas llamarensis]|uniref:Flagellar motor switch protein FliN n=1 Tax=Halomonas llamarensis TaxID=2945104 RepID=A0ABT0SNB0_9GAMM|nr:flagellar motor switch protein FliN [Halomonas llamarensis]MCL7929288.1 flagellar motor switch protein FliN [Halomonas llamarensis]
MTDPNKPDDQNSNDQNSDDQNISDDDWAAAMSEQEPTDGDTNTDDDAFEQAAQQSTDSSDTDSSEEEEDPWAAAMAEQQAVEEDNTSEQEEALTPEPPQAKAATSDVFPPLDQENNSAASRDLEMIMDIPVKLTVELGRTKLTIKQLLELAQGSVIELDGLAGEPMDILINGYLVAQGEVVVIEDKYGIRITEIITPSERIHKLNR